MVMDNIYVNTRSSIKLMGTKTVYFDPLDIEGTPNDADLIFITHEHYDHYSPNDIRKVITKTTQMIVPDEMLDMVKKENFPLQTLHGMTPSKTKDYNGVKCQGIPAYNIGKPFHPKDKKWLGYLVELDGKSYYAMGDTDSTPEVAEVDADVVFIPIGGKYTMDASEAAILINEKHPELIIPIHFTDPEAVKTFKKALRTGIEVKSFW